MSLNKLRCTQIPFLMGNNYYVDTEEGYKVLVVVAHRRGGKSVGITHSLKAGVAEYLGHDTIKTLRGDVDTYDPVFTFFAPTKIQARNIIWKYLVRGLGCFPGVKFNSQTLTITIPRTHLNDTIEIMLMASKQHDRARGLKIFKGYIDEFQDAPEACLYDSVAPALKDANGELVVTGTAKGEDHFYRLVKNYIRLGAPAYLFPIDRTGIFTEQEINDIREETRADTFEREYMCNFTAPVEGAFYYKNLKQLEKNDDFRTGMHDPTMSNILACDIGVGKGFAAWLAQVQGDRIVLLDYYDDYSNLEELRLDLLDDGYNVDVLFIPHDGNKRQVAAFKTVRIKDIFKQVFKGSKIIQMKKTPNKMASIDNVNRHLNLVKFPSKLLSSSTDAYRGLRKLKEFSRKKNESDIFIDQIDKSKGVDHAADALEVLFVGLNVKKGRIYGNYSYKNGVTAFDKQITTSFYTPEGNVLKGEFEQYYDHTQQTQYNYN